MTPAGWQQARWGDVATLEYGKALRDYASADGHIPVYGTNGPIGWHTQPLTDGPGVVVGRKGAYRGIHYADTPFFVIDTAFYLKPQVDLDTRWAYYELRTKDINGMDTGSAIPSTTRKSFYALPLLLPPLREQRAIAGVLGALDDKIELNRRMNETLEALAQSLYAKLLKSRHQVARLGDVLELAYGKALKASNRQPGAVPVYGSNGIVGYHDEALSPGPGIIIGRKGNPGIVTWADDAFYAIDTTFYVLPRTNQSSLYHLYFALCKLDLPSFAADSAVPGLNRNIAYGLEIGLPEPEALQQFDSVVSSLFAKRAANERESRTLAELRDTLLPKLISGELRVSSAT